MIDTPPLGIGEVHVWEARLGATRSFEGCLTEEERTRARRFHFEADRARHAFGRGLVRTLLGRYAGRAPGSVPIVLGPQGKPRLDSVGGLPDLRFNVSHSHEVVVVALTLGHDVGVDVEHIVPARVAEDLVRRFFSPLENETWFALPPEARVVAFYRCWTRKEAFVKARGEGLTVPTECFSVSLASDGPARLLEAEWDPREPARWTLADLPVGRDYAGAVAVEGESCRLHRHAVVDGPDEAEC